MNKSPLFTIHGPLSLKKAVDTAIALLPVKHQPKDEIDILTKCLIQWQKEQNNLNDPRK